MTAPVRTLYVRGPFRKSTGNSGGTERDLDRFYVNTILQDQIALHFFNVMINALSQMPIV